MKLLLPPDIVVKLQNELRRGGRREIGGVLVGEHIEGETFRVVDFSVQSSGGTTVHFLRDPAHHKAFLDDFFRRTGQNYQRFNYIGEWHSHPSFRPIPSPEDLASMKSIVRDPDVGVNFAVLIIVRLRMWSRLEMSASVFRRGAEPFAADVEVEADQAVRPSLLTRMLRFLVGT